MKNKQIKISENSVLKILAIVLSLILWVYVKAQQPVAVDVGVQIFKDIEVNWETNSNYIVTAITDQYVDVSVRGLYDKLSTIQSGDIKINLDLTEYTDGKHTVVLVPQLPRGIQLQSISPSEIDIIIDKWQSEEKSVEIEYLNELPTELVIEKVTFDPPKVTVEGASSALEDISRIVIPYNMEMLGVNAENLVPEARDIYNKTISNVSIKQNVNVSLAVNYRKTLPVSATFTGELPDDISYKIEPDRVAVLGPKAELDLLSELFTAEIDIENVKKGEEIEVAVIYPDNLEPGIQEYQKVTVVFE